MNNTILFEYFKTPIGEMIIGSFNDQICICDWRYRKSRISIDQRLKNYCKADFIEEKTIIVSELKNQLNAYFENKLTDFDIPFQMFGTEFQKSVWSELLNIPFGNTLSYLELSKKLNNESAIRAVAAANGANAISIIIPCHRIIGNNGDLIGYAGGLAAKKKLLELENPLKFKPKDLFSK